MLYAVQQRSENQTQRVELPKVVDPILLKAAQKIYRTYCEVNPNMVKRPTGVVINQLTYRGQLLFSSKPILLPQECFIPLSQIES